MMSLMTFATIFVNDDKWLEECLKNSPGFPNPPCFPPGMHFPTIAALFLCGFFAFITFVSFVYSAIVRERSASPAEFREAKERILASIVFLTVREGQELRELCGQIARDLIRIMGFVQKEISDCHFEHYGRHLPENEEQIHTTLRLMYETERMRRAAAFLTVLLWVKPLFPAAYDHTSETTARFMTHWLTLLDQYRLKHPECADRFPIT